MNRRNRYILIFLAFLLNLLGHRAFSVSLIQNQGELPRYIIVLEQGGGADIPEMEDSLFNSLAEGMIYRVNSIILDTKAPVLADIVGRLEMLAAPDSPYRLAGIEYRAAASPEGPYNNNRRLANGRAKAFEDFLSKYIDMSTIDIVHKRVTIEDYEYLVWLMQQANDPETDFVMAQIAKYGLDHPAKIKTALRNRKEGRLWRRILRDYYPPIRATRVVMYFEPVIRDTETEDTPPDGVGMMRPALEPVGGTIAVGKPSGGTPLMPPLAQLLERPHLLSVSSNLLYDAFYMPQYGMAPMPNIGVELYPQPESRWTFKAQFMFPYYHRWHKQQFFQIRDYHLEARRYFNPGRLHTGWYLGAFVNATKYGIGLSATKGWEGEGMGAALKVGYVLPLGTGRCRLDFHAALGTWITRYDPYVYGNPITGGIIGDNDKDYYYDYTGNPDDFIRRNHRLTWFGPAEIGVSLTFDVLYRRLLTQGVSFLRYGP